MMRDFFSIGELAKYQKISKQTLIFYDKIGLFQPDYVNPENGYRYYSAKQLDLLDTILIMKKIGFSLEDIKQYMKTRNIENSRLWLRRQLEVIEGQMRELALLRSRILQKCKTLDEDIRGITVSETGEQYILCEPVQPPYDLTEISIATKKCFAAAFEQDLPIFFQAGVIVPRIRLDRGDYIQASHAFVPIEYVKGLAKLQVLPAGRCVTGYHVGEYLKIGSSYQKIFDFCRSHGYTILSDSYEFCIHDHITAKNEKEYITKIMFYVQ